MHLGMGVLLLYAMGNMEQEPQPLEGGQANAQNGQADGGARGMEARKFWAAVRRTANTTLRDQECAQCIRVLHHFFIGLKTVGVCCSCKKQAQKIIHFGNGSYG